MQLFEQTLNVINLGIPGFADDLRAQGVATAKWSKT